MWISILFLVALFLTLLMIVLVAEKRISEVPVVWRGEQSFSGPELEEEAKRLLDEMSLDEKVSQLSGGHPIPVLLRLGYHVLLLGRFPNVHSGYNARLGIPPMSFTDGPKGIVIGSGTCFPVAMARGASWDRELESRIGDAMGKEARAIGANYFGGLCINLLRHPSWGRSQETFGEDPYLLGELGVSMIKGVQAHKVMVCAKHFALNSVENSRFYINVQIDERPLHEVYLPHFRKCVEAGVDSIMSAYNKMRGEHCGHNRHLLTEILREEWGFEGFVSSDWLYGIRSTVPAIKAGMDIEMPAAIHYGRRLRRAVKKGKVSMETLDKSVLRVLRTKRKRLSGEDSMDYPLSLMACEEHTRLAREAAEKSMVLLQNKSDVLPFDAARISKLGVLGRLAQSSNLGDHGSSRVSPPYTTSPLQGIQNYLKEGVEVHTSTGKDIETATALAAKMDSVVLIVGFNHFDEGETITRKPWDRQKELKGGDRAELELPAHDVDLIQRVAEVQPNLAVVIISGGAVTMEDWRQQVPSILMAWYPGMEGGNALAKILFGEVNPSGKLPFTIPKATRDLPFFDPFAKSIEYGPLHGYTLLANLQISPAFPFGHGLSYTNFAYDNVVLSASEINQDETLEISVSVQNTGVRAGAEVVQVYLVYEDFPQPHPPFLLKGFEKVSLDPGEISQVTIAVAASDLAWFDPDSRTWRVEPTNYKIAVGPSSDPDTWKTLPFSIVE